MRRIQGFVSARRNTAANWLTKRVVLDESELGHEFDTNKFKLGDGVHIFQDPILPYFIDEPAIDAKIFAATGGLTFVHDQTDPSASWIVAHNFGRPPGVAIYIGGELVWSDVYATDTIVTIDFPEPAIGKLVLT